MSDLPVTLESLARQLSEMLEELRSLRDEMRQLTAIVMRLDGTVSGMVAELRTMRMQ